MSRHVAHVYRDWSGAVQLTNHWEIICVYQCLFQKYLRLADSSQIYVARSPMVGIKRFIIRLISGACGVPE
ncbi:MULTISPECIES: hypothetical protein [unclassified Microcoleus]|nr:MULTISPECIES: hypothetical protein [unclassified Microcoleus]